MIILKVPYAEKDQAKALGARWNKERKVWYVPDGAAATPFERWIAPGNAPGSAGTETGPAKAGKVDSIVGKTSVGVHYLDLAHDCNPFAECAECAPKLAASGWLDQHRALRQVLASLTVAR